MKLTSIGNVACNYVLKAKNMETRPNEFDPDREDKDVTMDTKGTLDTYETFYQPIAIPKKWKKLVVPQSPTTK